MSHAVVRGKPTAAQLYLDTILNEVLGKYKDVDNSVPRKRSSVTIAEVLYHSLSKRPNDLYMIKGNTDERFTNGQILRFAVSVARASEAAGAKGKVVVLFVRNHEQMAALYNGLLFAGAIPCFLELTCTAFEIKHFFNIAKPYIVFCDKDYYGNLKNALNGTTYGTARIVIANDEVEMANFCRGHSDDPLTYSVAKVSARARAMMLPTSGSTGLPKASVLTHQGLVAQLPAMWGSYTKFPAPTKLVKVVSSPPWMTHTILVTSCTVYQVPFVITPIKTSEHILKLYEKYQPTLTLYSPPLAVAVAAVAKPNQMSSIETLLLTGCALTPDSARAIKSKLSKNALVSNGYGMTETQSFIALADRSTPEGSNGRVFNAMDYKIVDDKGNKLGPNQIGELCVKSDICVFEEYYNDDESHRECFSADGWLKTGDFFYTDEDEYLFYVSRKKFLFYDEYYGHNVSPEEVECIISSVPGVQESIVCGTSKGAAAVVIRKPNSKVTREEIQDAVSVLSEYKQLRGGIAFVEELPRTHSGKARRIDCAQLLADLLDAGLCY